MPYLPQALVSRVGHRDMVHRPFSRIPALPGLGDPEDVDVPVEICLQVPWRHPREAPQVALELGARVVHHLHPLQIDRTVRNGPACLVLEPDVPDRRVIRPSGSLMNSGPGAILPPMAFVIRAELGFPWLQAITTWFLWTTISCRRTASDGAGAQLRLFPAALGVVSIVDVGFVHPDGIVRHDSDLVAGCRCEHACRRSKADLWVTPPCSSARSTGSCGA